jgi:hypothetical protein
VPELPSHPEERVLPALQGEVVNKSRFVEHSQLILTQEPFLVTSTQ